MAYPMMWVKLTLPPRPRARWLLITIRAPTPRSGVRCPSTDGAAAFAAGLAAGFAGAAAAGAAGAGAAGAGAAPSARDAVPVGVAVPVALAAAGLVAAGLVAAGWVAAGWVVTGLAVRPSAPA